MSFNADVIIIGAGPSGAVSGALLAQKGYKVLILERAQFPRFSIGESLLPQCMTFLEEAKMIDAVKTAKFQYKNGAIFECGDQHTFFNFEEKFTPGWGTTFQVQRDRFDKILADRAEVQGVEIHYQENITAVDFEGEHPILHSQKSDGNTATYRCQFVLDASGFGRVLPRLLDLEAPSDFPVRQSTFTHIEDNIDADLFDRNKIIITVHPKYRDVWYWLIPFSNGRCSIGVVGEPGFFAKRQQTPEMLLKSIVNEAPGLQKRLTKAKWDTPINQITGYSSNVKTLYGKHFALLGNAGEFLDPVFSSGVTIALKSASLAANLLDTQLQGHEVDWKQGYQIPLQFGVNTFRCYVEAWYDHSFQDIIFSTNQNKDITDKISSILAGYAWDDKNPYVKQCKRKLPQLAKLCQQKTSV